MRGDPGERRGEDEGLQPTVGAPAGEGRERSEATSASSAPSTADVAQQHQASRALPSDAGWQAPQLAADGHPRTPRSTQVHARTAPGHEAAAAALAGRPSERGERGLGVSQFLAGQLGEVGTTKRLVRAGGLQPGRRQVGRVFLRRSRVPLVRAFGHDLVHVQPHHGPLAERPRFTATPGRAVHLPERVEYPIEERAILVSAHAQRLERIARVAPLCQPDTLQDADTVHQAVQRDAQANVPEQAPEHQQVGQQRVRVGGSWIGRVHQPL
jgi:hypothetical protein